LSLPGVQFWSHRVTALEPSISVNVFSDTAELLTYYAIQRRSLEPLVPFMTNGPQVCDGQQRNERCDGP